MRVAWTTWVVSLTLCLSAQGADVDTALKTLQTIGPMGHDNQAAQRSWQVVSQASPGDLPALLGALDTASVIGSNYLRSAIEAVADRHLRQANPTAQQALQAFLSDTSHHPRARRLAFDLLTRLDPSVPDRLIPTFINDPSTELRRDAVQRLINEAKPDVEKASSDAASKQRALEILKKAFAGARDLDQIEQLAKDLKPLGHEVDLPRHYGFVTSWKLLGPFDNRNESAFDIAYPPEKSIDLKASVPGKDGKTVSWLDHASADPHGKVDFNKALGKANGVVGYAFSEFVVQQPRAVEFRTGCICAFKLWVNGQQVDAHNVYHSGTKIDQYVAQGTLRAGRNTILIKVLQNEQKENWAQDWDFQLRVCDSVGTAVLSDDRLSGK